MLLFFYRIIYRYTFINNGIKNQQKTVIKTTATRFITNPALAICLNLICPLAKTIAFGGVPIGIIPATLAANAIGIPNISGLIPIASANEETTGAKTIT